MTDMQDLVPDAQVHYWHPGPEPQARRHAFKGARRWEGQTAGTTVCGVEVAMARASEMDWVYMPTCGFCWEALISEQRKRDAQKTKNPGT